MGEDREAHIRSQDSKGDVVSGRRYTKDNNGRQDGGGKLVARLWEVHY